MKLTADVARATLRVVLPAVALSAILATAAHAQATIVIARIAVKDAATFRFAEVFHEFGKWVFPDVGYIDYGGASDYREFFAGLGRTLVRSQTVTLVGEVYYLQTAGDQSGSARYAVPWVLFAYRSPHRILGEAVYFPYVPLNSTAQRQHVLERAKLEYAFDRVKVGAGYGAYQARGVAWQHRPFLTMTVSPPRIGDVELWLQRVPELGVQLQLRYQRVFK